MLSPQWKADNHCKECGQKPCKSSEHDMQPTNATDSTFDTPTSYNYVATFTSRIDVHFRSGLAEVSEWLKSNIRLHNLQSWKLNWLSLLYKGMLQLTYNQVYKG